MLYQCCAKGVYNKSSKPTLCEKCPYSEFFWSAFSHIRTDSGEIRINNAGKYEPEKLRIRTFSRSANIANCFELKAGDLSQKGLI